MRGIIVALCGLASLGYSTFLAWHGQASACGMMAVVGVLMFAWGVLDWLENLGPKRWQPPDDYARIDAARAQDKAMEHPEVKALESFMSKASKRALKDRLLLFQGRIAELDERCSVVDAQLGASQKYVEKLKDDVTYLKDKVRGAHDRLKLVRKLHEPSPPSPGEPGTDSLFD